MVQFYQVVFFWQHFEEKVQKMQQFSPNLKAHQPKITAFEKTTAQKVFDLQQFLRYQWNLEIQGYHLRPVRAL